MKVVLFCGGLGMRLRESEESLPKPLVKIGYLPILWHVMKYYAHFGHKDFILCLGYRADAIKTYFLNYSECISNDFVLHQGDKQHLEFVNGNGQDWKITFVDTGIRCNIGQRLKAVERYLGGDEYFLANYADGLTDLYLPDLVQYAQRRESVATFVSVRPNLTYTFVSTTNGGTVRALKDVSGSNIRINGGYYVFRREIFEYLTNGDDLVEKPFQQLIERQQLSAYKYDGFWAAMDTFKDKTLLEELHASGDAPWAVWKNSLAGAVAGNGK